MEQMVYQTDLLDFVAQLEAIAAQGQAQAGSQEVINAMADEVKDVAVQLAPSVTGELRDSIEVRYGQMSASVVATAGHAAYVEFGTWSRNIISPKSGTYTIEPKRPGGTLRFTGSDGRTVFTRKVEHPGIPAQQFLARANAEVIERFTNGIAAVGVKLIVE